MRRLQFYLLGGGERTLVRGKCLCHACVNCCNVGRDHQRDLP